MEKPKFYPSISVLLSHILDINGMRLDLRQKRRHLFLRMEVLKTNTDIVSGKRIANYHFGSQTEATTMHHFNSDVDTLYSFIDFDVKQTADEWGTARGEQSYRKYKLVINTEHSPPGYVRLQDISEITPEKLALGDLVEEEGKFFYSSTNFFRVLEEKGTVRQGPSKADAHEYPGRLTADRVYAYPCRSWPEAFRGWTEREKVSGWPDAFLTFLAKSKGCFLVPVGHKLSHKSDIEWRLSPSLAERLLMFSLNGTHIKCYVLLKHIVKYFVKPSLGQSLTSFHCKTAVLTLAEKTSWELWRPDRLLDCMDMCLRQLIVWCKAGWCPQYILPEENLFAGRMSSVKLMALRDILLLVYNSKWLILRNQEDWGLGETLQMAVTGRPYVLNSKEYFTYQSQLEFSSNHTLFRDILEASEDAIEVFVRHQWPIEVAAHVLQMLIDADNLNEETCFKNLVSVWGQVSNDKERLHAHLVQEVMVDIMPVISLYIGCVISSLPGRRGNEFWWSEVYAEWIQPCFKQYRVLGSLKLATVLLARGEDIRDILSIANRLLTKLKQTGEEHTDLNLLRQLMLCQEAVVDADKQDDVKIAKDVLDYIESEYLDSVVFMCPCRLMFSQQKRSDILRTARQENMYFTFCVFFMRGEMNIVPYPLKFEFYRSSAADKETRDPYKDQWMDMAAIDVAPYLYFLQYECCRHQNKQDQKQNALLKLMECVCEENDLFHRETALNLLGYCMLLENRIDDAFTCFRKSLQIQPDNNCATWHIALMVNKLLLMSDSHRNDNTAVR